MVEYRPVPEDDVDEYNEILDYAFRAEAGPAPDRENDGTLDAVVRRLDALFPPRECSLREFF